MYYNDYSLRQLLEFALRVPEVGAVNFNILYYILKSIIQKQGLENVKPVFSFEAPLTTRSVGTNMKDVSLTRSYSADSLKVINTDELKGTKKDEIESDGTPEARPSKSLEKESNKWHRIKVFKRVDAVEDEVSEIHIMIAQLVDKISNLERVVGLQETKYCKEITELQRRLESNEVNYLAEKPEKISSDAAVMMAKGGESDDSKSGKEDEDTGLDDTIPVKSTVSDTAKKQVEVKVEEQAGHKKEDKHKYITKKEVEVKVKEQAVHKKEDKYKFSDPDITVKMDTLFNDVNKIKEQLKMVPKFTESGKDTFEPEKSREDTRKSHSINKGDIEKIDLELLNISMELHKLKEKCLTVDKMFNSDLNMIKEKNMILERNVVKYEVEIDLLKSSWDEIIHNFESLKENMELIQKEINMLTELPGLMNRMEQLEGYVFSGYDDEREEAGEMLPPSKRRAKLQLDSENSASSHKIIPKAKKVTTSMAISGAKADLGVIEPMIKKMEKAKARDVEEYLDVDSDPRKFKAVALNVALVQDLAKKKVTPKLLMDETYKGYEEEDDIYEEPLYESEEKPPVQELKELCDVLSSHEVSREYSVGRVKPSTFTSPDILEEHSRQLKGQVIVYLKKHLQAFELDLQHIEGDLITVKKKNELLEKCLKELAIKVAVAEANFSQRAGDLAALKGIAENHQVSIVNIIHHLDRKAEAYAVNQKVSRKELTSIEDRVLKLCMTSSSDITKLEDKLDDSLIKFSASLDRKLFKEEFEVHFESLLHKLKMLDFKIRDVSVQNPVLDLEAIRPIEIKKYIMSKDGTKMKQGKKKVASQSYETDGCMPVLMQHHADREASPKTALRIQKELELTSYRDSKRYAEGTYTKIKVGRK